MMEESRPTMNLDDPMLRSDQHGAISSVEDWKEMDVIIAISWKKALSMQTFLRKSVLELLSSSGGIIIFKFVGGNEMIDTRQTLS